MDDVPEWVWFNDRRYSQIKDRYPDPKVFPNFYKAKRMEFILRPGEMIFIPTGMFHFVFSEDPDPETGLCAAINFWYNSNKGDEGDPDEKPKFGWHDLHLKFDEIRKYIGPIKIHLHSSTTKCFPPFFMKHRFPNVSTCDMTFDEFYEARNPQHYISQFKCSKFDELAIPHNYPLRDSSIWINWGDCYTLPHYDGMDNWLCQLKGTRRVILVPQNERDLMYILNPYSPKLLTKLFNAFSKPSDNNKIQDDPNSINFFIHKELETLDSFTIEKFLETLGDNDECIVMCELLEESYKRKLNGATFKPKPHPVWKTFKIKKYFEHGEVPNEDYLGVLWFLTEGQVKMNEHTVFPEKGSTLSFSAKVRVKVLCDCIIITPHGSSYGN